MMPDPLPIKSELTFTFLNLKVSHIKTFHLGLTNTQRMHKYFFRPLIRNFL